MPNKYANERSKPKVPACGSACISLLFDGRHLRSSGTKSAMVFPAVSGKPDKEGKFNYSPDRQKIPSLGPIPEGEYWIQPSEMWENNWLKSAIHTSHSAWGNYRITIHPYPHTMTHAHGGFFIHGGATPGSSGCIDLTLHMDKFVQDLKNELKGLPECFIPLAVRYAKN